MSAQCDVRKKATAKRYPAFGERLFSIVSENLPNGATKNKNSVVNFLRHHADLGFDTSCAYAWLKGDVLGNKPLVPDNFKRILLFYIGKAGLGTLKEVQDWLALAPERYEEVLRCVEVQNKLRSEELLKQGCETGQELAERQKLWDRLVNLIYTASTSVDVRSAHDLTPEKRLIILQGPPGVGKTMFLNRLWIDPTSQARFELVFPARFDKKMSPQAFLDFCLRKLLPKGEWSPGHPIVLNADLQKALQGKRILFLIDRLDSPEEIEELKPLCAMGCWLVIATRCLEVARQADYSSVVEMKAYSIGDVIEYYAKNYADQPSPVTQDKLLQLAEMVCFNPLGLNIALRRVAEEGWDTVMRKVRLAPSFMKEDVFEDLHRPLWLAYSSLNCEDQEKYLLLGALPTLASYDEKRLSLLWGVSKTKANEVLVRLEKEAGFVQHCVEGTEAWHIHPQVLSYARFLLSESSLRMRIFSRFYPARVAFHEKRPHEFHHLYKRGVKSDVVKKYWQMIREESKRRKVPLVLGELRRFIEPSYSTDWSVLTQLTSNCTLEDYVWGYHMYLAAQADIWIFFTYLFLVGILGGIQSLFMHYGILSIQSILLGILNLFLLSSSFIWAFHLVLRDLRRRYDWGQLWQKVTAEHKGE
jgi:hypothetical protein